MDLFSPKSTAVGGHRPCKYILRTRVSENGSFSPPNSYDCSVHKNVYTCTKSTRDCRKRCPLYSVTWKSTVINLMDVVKTHSSHLCCSLLHLHQWNISEALETTATQKEPCWQNRAGRRLIRSFKELGAIIKGIHSTNFILFTHRCHKVTVIQSTTTHDISEHQSQSTSAFLCWLGLKSQRKRSSPHFHFSLKYTGF